MSRVVDCRSYLHRSGLPSGNNSGSTGRIAIDPSDDNIAYVQPVVCRERISVRVVIVP